MSQTGPSKYGASSKAYRAATLTDSECPSLLVVGEAPGLWGCRFTGVPFTSEGQFVAGELPFPGRKSSLHPLPHRERAATVFWRALGSRFPRFLAWNSIPLHPHRPGEPLSIRSPTIRELAVHRGILRDLCDLLKPVLVLAIGRSGERALANIGVESTHVRHPSHGGVAGFRAGIETICLRQASEATGRVCPSPRH